jgi:hypothetical protein
MASVDLITSDRRRRLRPGRPELWDAEDLPILADMLKRHPVLEAPDGVASKHTARKRAYRLIELLRPLLPEMLLRSRVWMDRDGWRWAVEREDGEHA